MIKPIITTLMLLFSPILHAADQNNPCAGQLMTTQAMDSCGKAIDQAVQKKQASLTQAFASISPSSGAASSSKPSSGSLFDILKQKTQQPAANPPASSTPKKEPFKIRFD